MIGYYREMAFSGVKRIGSSKFDLMNIRKFRYILRPFFYEFAVDTVLDYGSGSCSWQSPDFDGGKSALDFFSLSRVCEYEPSLAKTAIEASDCVVCFDVLEHVAVEDVFSIVDKLFRNAYKLVAVNIANYPSRAVLPNGENCHITRRPYLWWKGVFETISSNYPQVSCFLCVSDSYWSATCSELFSAESAIARFDDVSYCDEPLQISLHGLDHLELCSSNDYVQFLLSQSRFSDALSACKLIGSRGDSEESEVLRCAGQACVELKNYPKAAEYFQLAYLLRPDDKVARALIKALRSEGQAAQSVSIGLSIESHWEGESRAGIVTQIGLSYISLGEISLAEEAALRAIECFSCSSEAFFILGIVESVRGNHDIAVIQYNKSIACDPSNVWPVLRRANEFLTVSKVQEAIDNGYDRRVESDPIHFREFLPLDSWRARCSSDAESVFILHEQGVGDQVYFSRFFSWYARRFQRVYCRIDARLERLFARSFPGVIFNPSNPVQTADQCSSCFPMGDMISFIPGMHLGQKQLGRYLRAASEPKRRKGECSFGRGLRLGISWRSGRQYIGARKSIPLSLMIEFLREAILPGDVIVCLQHQVDEEEFKQLEESGFGVEHGIHDSFSDFDSQACMLASCDIVLTISNVNAHLSGALGVETFVLVPPGLGLTWYWGRQESQSSWYKSVKIFRSLFADSWALPLEQACAGIAARRSSLAD
ncbi:tetratricopeptide repeat protein [Synechococcus sp. CS-1328]|nr:tetratricopeptide repeat protein [Synechococcus sp. CS-1328]